MSLKYLYRFFSHKVIVACPEADIAAQAALFTALELNPAPDDAKADITLGMTDGNYLITYRQEKITCASKDDCLINLTTLINAHFFNQATTQPILHAGGFNHPKGAVLFAGAPYSGKSTLALHAWKAGEQLLGDDWLIFDSLQASVSPLPKPIKPRMNTGQKLARTKGLPDSSWIYGQLREEWRLMISRQQGFYNHYYEPLPISALFFISRGNTLTTQAVPLSKADALQSMLTETMLSSARLSLHGVRLLDNLWSEGKVHQLIIGEDDFETAIELMKAHANLINQASALSSLPRTTPPEVYLPPR